MNEKLFDLISYVIALLLLYLPFIYFYGLVGIVYGYLLWEVAIPLIARTFVYALGYRDEFWFTE